MSAERTTERWLYLGVRESQGKRYDAFTGPEDRGHWYGALRNRSTLVLGGYHTATVDEAGTVFGTPIYTGERVDRETLLRLTAIDNEHKQRLAAIAQAKKAGKDDAIYHALEDAGLIRLMKEQRSQAAREALLAHVNLILARSW